MSRRVFLRYWLLAAFAISGLSGCAKNLSERIYGAGQSVKTNSQATITLSVVTDFDWYEVYIFTPYTPVTQINAELGYNWPGAKSSGIESSETIYLLVFTKHGKVVYDCTFSRKFGDFQGLDSGHTFSPATAVFEIKAMEGYPTRLIFLPKRN